MNYSEMTDFEINCAVGKYFPDVVIFQKGNPVVFEPNPAATYTGKDFDEVEFDPCNSWEYAGPIIEDNEICLAADVFAEPQDGGKWVCQPAYGWERERVRHNNPLRAAMIVFLMMKESDN